MIIRSRSPVRIGLGGGGTDVSPYTEEYGGAVLNVTINKYAWGSLEFTDDKQVHMHSHDFNKTISLNNLADIKLDGDLDLLKLGVKRLYHGTKGLQLFLRSDVPPRSGLGGSAAAFVAVVGLFNAIKNGSDKLNPYEIAELAYEMERKDMGIHGGRQDQYATVFGGMNFMEFKGNDFVRVTPVKLKQDYLLELEKNLVLCRVNIPRPTDDVLTDQKKNVSEGKSLENMHQTKQIAYDMHSALLRGDLNRFGELLHEGWLQKKQFSSLISNPHIDNLYDSARKAGAIGGKISGAGGGGHMIFYCAPNSEMAVRKSLQENGATPVDFSFEHSGMQTWEVN